MTPVYPQDQLSGEHVGHQTVCIDSAIVFVFKLYKIFSIVVVVIIRNKYRLPVMAPLHYMMRGMRKNYSG
jgi:hypothetical protein